MPKAWYRRRSSRRGMFCDMIIIASSYFVLHDLEKVVYGYVTLFVTGSMIDQVVNTNLS